ncbi:MAG: hypothetical protein JWQ74_2195 [Marmoricola sp.]|nr:hypothetical protein [Marmoricola sp.]
MSDLTQRYGAPSTARRRTLIVVSTVVSALFLGWLTWVVLFHSSPAIQAELNSYDVVSAHETRIKVDGEFRDDQVDGTCLFRATAEDHTIVGEINLTVAQIRAAQGQWIPLTTLNTATTVEKISCTER